MNKIYTTTFLIFFYYAFLYSQKYDYTWILGIDTLVEIGKQPDWKNKISFNDKVFQSEKITSKKSIMSDYNLSASDSSGNLIFYFNGLRVFNSTNKIMDNGDSIGYFVDPRFWKVFNRYCGCIPFDPFAGYTLPISTKFINVPEWANQYIIFAPLKNGTPEGTNFYDILSFIRIDMELAGGQGAVIEKNNLILDSHIDGFGLVKHANGTNWWLVAPIFMSNIFYSFLITKEGILGPKKQKAGPEIKSSPNIGNPPTNLKVTATQYGNFSPDGKMFVRNELDNGIFIYDFDRCTGALKFKRQIRNIPFTTELEFSPDSRFLYLASGVNLYQVDLNDDDDDENLTLVAILPTASAIETGPDGRIYLAHNSINYIGYINRPNLPGVSCDVKPMTIELPEKINYALPQFPNYRLEALNNGICPDPDPEFLPFGEPQHFTVDGKDYISVKRFQLIKDDSWKELYR